MSNCERKILYIVPFEDVEEEVLNALAEKMEKVFGCSTKIKEPVSIQKIQPAYNRGRLQYLSSYILDMLEREHKEGWRTLGVIEKDLYAPGLNFVFGQATLGGRACIISLSRLHESFYGRNEDKTLFLERTVKEAVHELGHTLGLGHCKEKECVMFFSNSIMDTDRKAASFCKECKKALEGRYEDIR